MRMALRLSRQRNRLVIDERRTTFDGCGHHVVLSVSASESSGSGGARVERRCSGQGRRLHAHSREIAAPGQAPAGRACRHLALAGPRISGGEQGRVAGDTVLPVAARTSPRARAGQTWLLRFHSSESSILWKRGEYAW